MFCEGMNRCVSSRLLGVVHGQSLVEHHNILMAPQGHPVRVQEAGRLCLLPDNIVPEQFLVGHNHSSGEGALPEQENRAVRLNDALILRPELFRRDNGIPGVLGGAVGQVTENHVYRFVFNLRQSIQAVNVINTAVFHTNSSYF